MGKHIETKRGLNTLLKRVREWVKGQQKAQQKVDYEEVKYWVLCIEGCIDEGLAMDETDYGNAPRWFKPLWKGLK